MSEKVTLRDVYDVVRDIKSDLQRTEEKLDRRIEKAEKEIDEIKDFQSRAIGVLSVMALFTSAIASFIWNKITGQS